MVVWCIVRRGAPCSKNLRGEGFSPGGSVAMILKLATVSDPLTNIRLHFITTSLGGALFWGVDIIYNS